MGFFSWMTQDTNKSIANHYSGVPVFTVYLMDDKGNTWQEDNYEGYGEFDGKDYYDLLDEMNGGSGDRSRGIELEHGVSTIRNVHTGEILDRTWAIWAKEIVRDKMSANELIDTGDWEQHVIKAPEVRYPNLVEDPEWVWRNDQPENCEFQGFFYDAESYSDSKNAEGESMTAHIEETSEGTFMHIEGLGYLCDICGGSQTMWLKVVLGDDFPEDPEDYETGRPGPSVLCQDCVPMGVSVNWDQKDAEIRTFDAPKAKPKSSGSKTSKRKGMARRKAKPKTRSSDLKKRKGPNTSATSFNLGTRKKGNDGKMWIVKRSGQSRRWVRAAEEAGDGRTVVQWEDAQGLSSPSGQPSNIKWAETEWVDDVDLSLSHPIKDGAYVAIGLGLGTVALAIGFTAIEILLTRLRD